MADSKDKTTSPPYASYKSLVSFFNGLKETHIPTRVDRSILSGMSGSAQSAILMSCRSLGLIDDAGIPSEKLHNLIESSDDDYTLVFKDIITDSYSFLFDGSINLERASGQQVAEKFRGQGLQGSTLTKAVSFFLSAAKDAGIKVSPHVKAPPPPRSTNGSKTKNKKKEVQRDEPSDTGSHNEEPQGMERITVPLRGMDDGIIYFPAELGKDDAKRAVKAAIFILNSFYELDDEE